MEKFEKTMEKWLECNKALNNDCKEYIKDILNKVPGCAVDVSDFDERACVSYDGGNHPEYASSCYSYVELVYLKGDDICLSIDDATDYSIDRIAPGEIYDVAMAVKAAIESDYDLSE